jgi:hypothetical protein
VVLVGTAALKDFKSGTGHGTISILSDSFGGSSTPFAQVGFAMAGQLTFTLGTHLMNVNYTIPAGHSLEITLIVPNSSQEDLWIAYDTLAYRSRIVMP